jgi:hypothetical protein
MVQSPNKNNSTSTVAKACQEYEEDQGGVTQLTTSLLPKVPARNQSMQFQQHLMAESDKRKIIFV